MKGIHILATGRALPRKIMSNHEMSRFVDTSDEWIRSRTGIGQRHVCEEESCVSLAVEAANDALAKAIKEYGITKGAVLGGSKLISDNAVKKIFSVDEIENW